MSDPQDPSDDDLDEELEYASLETEEQRDWWIDFLLNANEDEDWCQAQTVQDMEGNMVARFRYRDGREEVFDLKVRRSQEVVVPSGEEGSN